MSSTQFQQFCSLAIASQVPNSNITGSISQTFSRPSLCRSFIAARHLAQSWKGNVPQSLYSSRGWGFSRKASVSFHVIPLVKCAWQPEVHPSAGLKCIKNSWVRVFCASQSLSFPARHSALSLQDNTLFVIMPSTEICPHR